MIFDKLFSIVRQEEKRIESKALKGLSPFAPAMYRTCFGQPFAAPMDVWSPPPEEPSIIRWRLRDA